MSAPCPMLDGYDRGLPFMDQNPSNALALNAVASVLLPLHGLTGLQPVAPMATFARAEGIPNKPLIWTHGRNRVPTPPDRRPSSLPPPGNFSMSLSLGKRVGHGRSGVVFEASIDIQNSSPALSIYAIPPLVVKIARAGRNVDLRHEAFYYDEMECIQGVVVPRCYGLFKASIPPGTSLVSPTAERKVRKWLHVPSENPDSDVDYSDDDSSKSNESDAGERYEDDHSGDSDDCDSDESNGDDGDKTSSNEGDDDESSGSMVHDSSPVPEDGSITVYILLVERLGEKLPIGRTLPDDIVPEILDLYTHLAKLGIDHVDIRHANILRILDSPPGWPTLVSPLSDNVYGYRIIDFERARKTNWNRKEFNEYYSGWVKRLLRGLPYGFTFEVTDYD